MNRWRIVRVMSTHYADWQAGESTPNRLTGSFREAVLLADDNIDGQGLGFCLDC